MAEDQLYIGKGIYHLSCKQVSSLAPHSDAQVQFEGRLVTPCWPKGNSFEYMHVRLS